MSRANTLVEIWHTYRDNMLTEKKQTKQPGKAASKFSSKSGPGAIDRHEKSATKMQNADSTGPANADGFKEPLDTKNASKENAYTLDRFTNAKKFDEDIKKSTQAMINNNMKKSKFDQLFEEVTGDESQDLDALGIDASGEGSDENAGAAQDESITVTLTHDQVECLKSILSQVEGGAEGDEGDQIEDEMSDGLNDETPEGDGDDQITEDQVKYEVLGTAITDEDKLSKGFTNTKGTANVVKSTNSTLAKKRGTGDPKSTDTVTSDDKSFNAKKGLENINPKSSIIKGTKTNKTGNDLFA